MPTATPQEPVSICLLYDDRTGHQRQLQGLAQQLTKLMPCDTYWLSVDTLEKDEDKPHFDICIGAGHKTHWPLWKLCRQNKAFSTVLMSPSLPNSLFNAVICPRHDGQTPSQRVLTTEGPINTIQPLLDEKPTNNCIYEHNLVLLGGPSKHFHWEPSQLFEQVMLLLERYDNLPWLILPSRRTPASTIALMQKKFAHDIILNRSSEIDSLLHKSQQVWVSADSSSMLYESLTAGKATGVLELKARHRFFRKNRLNKELQGLIENQRVMRLGQHLDIESIANWPRKPMNEAERAARWLLARYKAWSDTQGRKNV